MLNLMFKSFEWVFNLGLFPSEPDAPSGNLILSFNDVKNISWFSLGLSELPQGVEFKFELFVLMKKIENHCSKPQNPLLLLIKLNSNHIHFSFLLKTVVHNKHNSI